MYFYSKQIQVSNFRDTAEQSGVDVCDTNSSIFYTLEVSVQNGSIVVASEGLSTTLPTALGSGLITVSIGSTPGTLALCIIKGLSSRRRRQYNIMLIIYNLPVKICQWPANDKHWRKFLHGEIVRVCGSVHSLVLIFGVFSFRRIISLDDYVYTRKEILLFRVRTLMYSLKIKMVILL